MDDVVARDPLLGSTVSHYRILSKLGQGGMGVVYRATDTRLQRSVAIKFLSPDLLSDPHALLRFEQEAISASALNHPNICTVHDIDQVDGHSLLVMEFVDGETLREILDRRGFLPEREVVDIVLKVCDALAAAHERGIIHRDIKPENIMLSREGYVKVMDFGLAKLIDRESEATFLEKFGCEFKSAQEALRTSASALPGTVSYMAPELIEKGIIDARADIFSLGAMLYELLTGKVPFGGATLIDILKSILEKREKDLCEANPNCSHQMASIVKRTLAKQPKARYQSVQELLVDLEKVKRPYQDTARGKEQATDEIRVPPRGKRRGAVIAAALLLLVLLSVIFQIQRRRSGVVIVPSQKLTIVAVLRFENASGNDQDNYLARGIWETLILRLSRLQSILAIPAVLPADVTLPADLKKIAREYNSDYVLHGRLEGNEEHLRLFCQLKDVSKNDGTWSKIFERERKDLLSLQLDLSEQIVSAMNVKLSDQERDRLKVSFTPSIDAYDYYCRGREYFAQRYETTYEAAIGLFKKALQIDPVYALACAGLGEAYLAQYDWYINRDLAIVDSANKYITRALTIDSNLPEAHSAYGDFLRIVSADKIPQAIDEYIVSLKLNSNNPDLIFRLLRLYKELGNFKEAEIWGKRFLSMRPTYAEAHIEMAMVSWFQGRIGEADDYFNHAIELQPDFPNSYGQKAYFAWLNGRWDEAKYLYEQTLKLDPKSHQAIQILAQIAFFKDQTGKAISLQEKSAKMGIEGLDYFNLGQIYRSLGNDAAAASCLDSALVVSLRLLKKSPLDHLYLSDLAIAHAAKNNRQLALEYIEKAKQTRDFKVNYLRKNRVLFREVIVYSLLGEKNKAIELLKQVLSLHMYSREFIKKSIGLENLRTDSKLFLLLEKE